MNTYCFINQVRPDRIEEYRRAHEAVWPAMLEALRDAGWRNYRLYLSDSGLLVGHFQAEDYERAQAAMASTAVNKQWQATMEQFFEEEGNPDEGFELLPQIFSLEEQLQQLGRPDHSPR